MCEGWGAMQVAGVLVSGDGTPWEGCLCLLSCVSLTHSLVSPCTAAINNSSDTESIPSPRTEATKDTGQNGPKPPVTDGPPATEPPTPPPEDAVAPAEPALDPEASGPPMPPPAPPSPGTAPPVVPKEEKEETASTGPPVEEGEELKPPVAEELALDTGKAEEPRAAPEEPVKSIKSECKEEAEVEEEGGVDKGKGAEVGPEAIPEGPLKVETKDAGSSKATAVKGSGAPQDSDSSATCSADEVDEPEGGDKNRWVAHAHLAMVFCPFVDLLCTY